MKAVAIFSVVLVFGANCVTANPTCPEFDVVKNFDMHRYLGVWYEYSNYFADFQAAKDCVYAEYSDGTTPGGPPQVDVINHGVNVITGEEGQEEGEAVVAEPENPEKPAKLIVNFDSQPAFTRATTANYNVIDTDYTSYAIVYSCTERRDILWIITRERNPDQDLIAEVEQKVKDNSIFDFDRLTRTNQAGCTNGPQS